MCCKIDLNDRKDAAHFLGKGEPTIIPKLNADNLSNGKVHYTNEPAMSVFDKLKALFAKKVA